MFDAGVEEEVRSALARGRCAQRPAYVHGLDRDRRASAQEALETMIAARPPLRRVPAQVDAPHSRPRRPWTASARPGTIADEAIAAHASVECLPRDPPDDDRGLGALARRPPARLNRILMRSSPPTRRNRAFLGRAMARAALTARARRSSSKEDGREGLVTGFVDDDPANRLSGRDVGRAGVARHGVASELVAQRRRVGTRGRETRLPLRRRATIARPGFTKSAASRRRRTRRNSRTSPMKATDSSCSSCEQRALARARQRVPRRRRAGSDAGARAGRGGRRRRHRRGDRARRRLGGHRDLEPRRLDRGDVRQRDTNRRGVGRRRRRAHPRRWARGQLAQDGRRTDRAGTRRRRGVGARNHRGARRHPGVGGQPARGRHRRPRRPPDDRPAARDARTLPEPHERAGRADRRARPRDGSRVGARRGGDERIRHERGRGRGRNARRGRSRRLVPGRRPHCAARGSRAAHGPERWSRTRALAQTGPRRVDTIAGGWWVRGAPWGWPKGTG